MKVCKTCKTEKSADSFGKNKAAKDGLNYSCILCSREIQKTNRLKNLDAYRANKRRYKKENAAEVAAEKRKYHAKYPELCKQRGQAYKKNNREKVLETRRNYEVARKNSDPLYRFVSGLRATIARSFGRRGYGKDRKLVSIIGCGFDQLYVHMVSTALSNYGFYIEGQEMHIDHVTPLATAKTLDDVVRLNHYSNLQWLTPEDNLKKGSKI